jgi:hypothetical protein
VIGTYDIKGYPTIGMFHNGKYSMYMGSRDMDAVINWAKSQ